MRRVFFSISIICALIGEIFFVPASANAVSSDIVITEIAAYEKSEHEWIEIYNKGSKAVDLSGWKFIEDQTNHKLSEYRGDLIIEPGEYAVIADNAGNTAADYPSFAGTLIDSSWQTLRQDGEFIAFADASGAIVEQFTYLPAPNGSLQRKAVALSDYSASNWIETPEANTIGAGYEGSRQAQSPQPSQPASGSPQEPESNPQTLPQQESASAELTPQQKAHIQSAWKPSRGDVVINEFVADPGDSPKEWVELYNNSPISINLTGWYLEDGSRNNIPLKGILGVSGNARFAFFETSNAILNNSGDSITLRDANGASIDTVSYGDWDDGVIENNAPRAQDPASVARFPDGYNSFYSATDFKVTEKPTKGESNILVNKQEISEKEPTLSRIVISELFPNPFPATAAQEFIELQNSGATPVDLDGWRIVAGSMSYTISKQNASSTTLVAGEYMAIPRSVSGIALRNYGGETVKLYEVGKEKALASLSYKIDAPPNKSYARNEGGIFAWTDTRTPDAANVITKANEPPVISLFVPVKGVADEEIFFDASDTSDPDNDPLSFEWDFGDGSIRSNTPYTISHVYRSAGTYQATLTVRDATHEETKTHHIAILGIPALQASSSSVIVAQEQAENVASNAALPIETTTPPAIFFNELLPDPTGRDRGQEFIELYNAGDRAVDISRWIIELHGGKTRYAIPVGSVMTPHGFFVVPQAGGSIVLRNGGDELVLRDPNGSDIDSIDYGESPEGKSFTRSGNDWVWTTVISRGMQNVIAEENKKSAVQTVLRPEGDHNKKSLSSTYIEEDFAGLNAMKQNTTVTVRGIITAPSGIFDPKELYISDGKNGILIRNTKNGLPHFFIGDTIEVRGSLKKYVSGPAITFGPEGSVRAVSGAQSEAIKPVQLSLQSITDDTLNALVTVSGEVTQARWPHIYIKDANGEIRAYVKKSTGIEKMDLQKGQSVDVSGILSKTASGYRILPRTAADIVVTGSRRVEVPQDAEYTIVAAHAPWQSYGIAALAAVAVVSGGLYFQYYQRRKNG